MTWTVTLQKPGREDKHVTCHHLGAWLELPVDRFVVQRSFDEWRSLTVGWSSGCFIETYALTAVYPEDASAVARFVSLRRMHELPARTLNPARLPA